MRILGEVKREYADLLRRADAIFIEELRATKMKTASPGTKNLAGLRGIPAGQERSA